MADDEKARILGEEPGDGKGYGTDANPDAPELGEGYEHLLSVLDGEPTAVGKLRQLKRFPLTLKEKRMIRDAVLGGEEGGEEESAVAEAMRRCRAATVTTTSRFQLWRRSLKSVEGMYGTGVASFFVFLRAILLLNVALFLLLFAFVVLPQGLTASAGTEARMLAALANESAVAADCSRRYNANLSASVAREGFVTRLQDFMSGTGWMERTVLFYGFYYPLEGSLFGEDYDFPLAYLLGLGGFFFVSLILVLVQTGRSFQESRVEEKTRTFERYARLLFASWDFALVSKNAARLKQRLIYNDVVAELSDEDHAQRHAEMTRRQRCGLYSIRVLVNLLIFVLLCVAAWVIAFVQQKSTAFTSSEASKTAGTVYRLLMEFLPSITIAAIGAAYPILFKLMVRAEDYKTENVVLITLLRTVFVKLFAVVVLVLTLYSLVTCEHKDMCNVGVGRCKAIACWETYVGQQFFKLHFLSFVIAVGLCFLVETPRALVVKKLPSVAIVQKIGKAEFDTPKNVLEIIYVQIVTWFGTLFCPFLPGIAIVVLVATFYVKLFSCYYNYQPSEQPYKASRSRFFFLIVLAFSYLLCIAPIGYCIVHIPVSKSCGPFRNLRTMYDIIPYTINEWPRWARNLFQWLGSAAFLFLGLIVLVALIYYHATIASTRMALNRKLKEEIELGNRDRRLLYKQLVDAGIEPRLGDRLGRSRAK